MTVLEQAFLQQIPAILKAIANSLEVIADEMKMRNELLSKDASKEKH